MLEGTIIKGIGGFYYVKVKDDLYECRARGVFRKEKTKPLVGDRVLIRANENDKTGYVEKIFERKTELIRPPVSNVNQAIIVFAVKNPDPNLWLLDRFLLLASYQGLDVVICFNKIDLVNEEVKHLIEDYTKAGYKVITTSCKENKGIDELRETLKDKISVFAGPSGVGKSTLLNNIQSNLQLKTGEISQKTSRGKHTTRHVELIELEMGGWVLDTPGFSSLDIDFLDEENLQIYFNDIYEKSHLCKFTGCKHDKEPQCAVKESVENGEISRSRYNNYLLFLKETMDNRRY
ncbi:putative ribosome biogenesis GTPase RsgA [Gottschalkia purinilytica]|uniref:Small ribosomal subunit biogenesis GTPase RsgA n=1 Tax=Gottschalkia purinilytica TaxID=1503 RepID=A0A0L0WB80_GOTPU|nr:ribosome small subunit-dependent GTPase A [Gottschalkia purinilytica]KNF08746.1 putative ribosome biogenesis GTPase RsgA [Gottschalkia purinilytica]